MLVIGVVGWGRPHRTHLTADEQYTQVSMWCLLSAPLLLGCDLQKLDAFTYSLISNDEVLDVDQDSLGKQAVCISNKADISIYAKPLDDGRWAVGMFNRGPSSADAVLNWSDLNLAGKKNVRDLWRQTNLGGFDGRFSSSVPSHGVVLIAISSGEESNKKITLRVSP
jgi:alpha-galactosidase